MQQNKPIVLKDLEKANVLDEISEFLFGIDSILERMILIFIFKEKNYTASASDLENHFVYVLSTCTKRRLFSRLDSLTKFKFIDKKEVNNHTFYIINDEWIKSLKKNNTDL